MTMAAAIKGRTAQTTAWSKPGRVAAIDIFADLGQAEAIWHELEERQNPTPPISGMTSSRPGSARSANATAFAPSS
jgi:hypothetical protein